MSYYCLGFARTYQQVLAPKKESSDEVIRRRKGGLSTKIHAICDALGNSAGFHIITGQAHDLKGVY